MLTHSSSMKYKNITFSVLSSMESDVTIHYLIQIVSFSHVYTRNYAHFYHISIGG